MTDAVTLTGDVRMPLIGFGTWQLKGDEAYNATRFALETGYRHIDTATLYGNETEVGAALRDSGVPRDEVFLTTKLPPQRAGRERHTLETSLKNLGVDRVDLWLIHWPPTEPAESVWAAFRQLRDAGLTRTIGVSNFDPAEIDELIAMTGEAPAVNQISWNPLRYDPDILAENRKRGVVIEGYSPLKSISLRNKVLREIGDAHGVTPAQVILRWHIEHGIVVIPRSARPARIEENFRLYGFTLTPDEVSRIDGLSEV